MKYFITMLLLFPGLLYAAYKPEIKGLDYYEPGWASAPTNTPAPTATQTPTPSPTPTLYIHTTDVELQGYLQADTQAYFDVEVDNGNSGASDTIDWTAGNKQKSTLTEKPCTFTFTAPSGPCNLILKLVQGSGGSKTVTWPGTVLWSGDVAPTLSTSEGAVDIIAMYYDGTSYYAVTTLDLR